MVIIAEQNDETVYFCVCTGSLLKRQRNACWKDRFVTLKEPICGRAKVTTNEEQVCDAVEITQICKLTVVNTLYARERNLVGKCENKSDVRKLRCYMATVRVTEIIIKLLLKHHNNIIVSHRGRNSQAVTSCNDRLL